MYFLRSMRNLVLVMGPVMLFVFVYSNFIQKRGDPVEYIGAGDPKMEAARALGRQTLPAFLDHLKAPEADESHFVVKFRLDRSQLFMPMQAKVSSEEQPAEFIWAKNLNLTPGGQVVMGFIDGSPRTKGFYDGQPVSIPVDDIVDWGYRKGEVVQGVFTTKVMLDRLPARDAQRARQAMGWEQP